MLFPSTRFAFYLNNTNKPTINMKYIVFNYIDKKIVKDNLTEKDLKEVYKTIDFNVEFVYRYVESDGDVSFVDWLIEWSNAVESNDTEMLDYLRDEYPEFFNSHYEAVFNAW